MEGAKITLQNVGSMILERIPGLKRSWNEEGLGPADEFPTILIENSLNDYIRSYSSLDAGQHERLAALVEDLLVEGNEIVKDVIEKLLLPIFCENQDIMDAYGRVFCNETRKRVVRVNIELGAKTKVPGEHSP